MFRAILIAIQDYAWTLRHRRALQERLTRWVVLATIPPTHKRQS